MRQLMLQVIRLQTQSSWFSRFKCLLDILPIALEATQTHMLEEAEKRDKLIAEVKKYGWSVNPETGKLEKL